MAGSIRQRKDRGPDAWELRVFIGTDSRGKPKQKSVLFRGTKRAAERELARLVTVQQETPDPVPEDDVQQWGPKTTVNDAIAAWRDNGWDDLSPKTVLGYDSIWNHYIRDTIGTKRIASLNAYEIERYFRKLKTEGAGRDTVRIVRSILHRACRLVSRWSAGALTNPVADTELPSWTLAERREPVRAPEAAEVRTLLRAAAEHDERFGAFLRLLAATGLRRGEACAVRWSDIDWDQATLTVDESVVASKGGAVIKSPKTRSSIRAVTLDDGTLDVLRGLQAHQEALANVCGVSAIADSFVFSYEPGGATPPYPDTMSHEFSALRKKAGVASDLHLHSLRHFQATVLDPVIPERQKQARMGWSTSHMARHYTDPIAAEDRRAAKFVGGVLDEDPDDQATEQPQLGQADSEPSSAG